MSSAAVLTCDIMGSREIQGLPKLIARTLTKLNKKYADELIASFDVTLGDEFQGVLKRAVQAYPLHQDLRRSLGIPFYAGLGVGTVDLAVDSLAAHMTGVAFVRSRDALSEAKRQKREFVARTGSLNLDMGVNALALAAQYIRSHQTQRQREIVELLLRKPTLTQREVAALMKISPAAVSKTLRTAGFEPLQEILAAIPKLLEINPERFIS